MILAIDAGNTRIKWGVHADGKWREQGVVSPAQIQTLRARAQAAAVAVVANVAGEDVAERVEALLADAPARRVWVRACRSQGGVANGYDDPAQLGADRWAALIGARFIHSASCLVVNAGTATTVDVLDDAGSFQGGVILPGLDLMRTSLASRTAQLPLAEGQYRATPRNTADAIFSGCLNAQAGAVDRMFSLIANQPRALCLVSGGAATTLVPALHIPLRHVENLVLEGLVRIGMESG